MFRKKKDVSIALKRQLSDDELCRVKDEAIKQFPALEMAWEQAFGSTNAKVFACSVAGNSIVYFSKRLPVLIDVEGKNDLYPTLKIISANLSCFRVIEVEDFVADCILKGADLLAPAITDTSQVIGMKKGDKIVLKAKSKVLPFAIGKSLVKGSFFVSADSSNMPLSGAVWTSVHFVTDALIAEMDVNTSSAYFAATEDGAAQSLSLTTNETGLYRPSLLRRTSSMKYDGPALSEAAEVLGTATDDENEDDETDVLLDLALPESNFDIFRKLVDIEVDNRQRQAELKTLLEDVQSQQQTAESQHVTAMQILNTSRLQQAALQKQINENSVMINEAVTLHQKTTSTRAEIGFMVASCSTQYKEMQSLHESLERNMKLSKSNLTETEEAKQITQRKLDDIIEQQKLLETSIINANLATDSILLRQSELETMEAHVHDRQEYINAQINTIVEIIEDCKAQTAEATRLCRDHSIEHEEVKSEASSVDVFGPKLQELQEKLDTLESTTREALEEITGREHKLNVKQQEIDSRISAFEVERMNFLEDYRTMVKEFETSKLLFFDQANKELEIQRQDYMDILESFEKDKSDFLKKMKEELLDSQASQIEQMKYDLQRQVQQLQQQQQNKSTRFIPSSTDIKNNPESANTVTPEMMTSMAAAAGLSNAIYEGFALKRADNSKMRLTNSWKKRYLRLTADNLSYAENAVDVLDVSKLKGNVRIIPSLVCVPGDEPYSFDICIGYGKKTMLSLKAFSDEEATLWMGHISDAIRKSGSSDGDSLDEGSVNTGGAESQSTKISFSDPITMTGSPENPALQENSSESIASVASKASGDSRNVVPTTRSSILGGSRSSVFGGSRSSVLVPFGSFDSISHEGHLSKKAVNSGKTRMFDLWKRRYMVLAKGILYYAETRDDIINKVDPKGFFALKKEMSVQRKTGSSTTEESLSITIVDAEGNTLMKLKGDDTTSSGMWYSSLVKAISLLA